MTDTHHSNSWGGAAVQAPSLDRIKEAAEKIKSFSQVTPLIAGPSFDQDHQLFFKPEILQSIGSYKIRGVSYWASSLSPEQRQAGLSTTSAGNTAQALGAMAQHFKVSARSLVPENIPENKLAALKKYGVDPVLVPMEKLLEFMFQEQWRDEPYAYLNPWGDPHMIAGHATLGLEIFDELPEVNTVFASVGGGALVCGLSAALKNLNPDIKVVAVQSEACPALDASFKAGQGVWVDSQPSLCDGTHVPVIVQEMYPMLRAAVDEVIIVSEEQVKAAIRSLALDHKMVVEGSGALSLAGAMVYPGDQLGQAVCVLSGGSISAERLSQLII